MNTLIDRYIYQVGLYVRPQERAEIERELRSQIHDQLDDRYGETPTQAQIVDVLNQLGDPRTMAASYSGEQYLVGPDLYPFLMTVLRIGLPLVPSVVVIANVVSAALSPDGTNWVTVLFGTIFTAAQAAIFFFALVVMIFAVLQHSGESIASATDTRFDPLTLPAVNDPRSVDRAESGVGIALALLFGLALAYFLQVGGLTLRFNLSDPGDVIPVPVEWLIVLLVTLTISLVLNAWALFRRRWTIGTWLLQMTMDVIGAFGVYFVIFVPVAERIAQDSPELAAQIPLMQLPAIMTVFTVGFTVAMSGVKLIRMWQFQQGVEKAS
jgi:hypothetical protein